jgi:hypothetical protein
MSRFDATPGITTNGLVLNLDAGDPDSYTRSQPPYVEVLVVAGGGGGGAYAAGAGGGAGGVIYNSAYQLTSAAAVTVTVGAGGVGQVYTVSNQTSGNNSVFGSLTAIGGGYGGAGWGGNVGANGGSGGGGAGYDGTQGTYTIAGGTGTAGQGNNGGLGRGISGNRGAAGGGGGAGQVGGDSTTNSSGNGGNGSPFSISGTSTYYGGGGGGGDYGSANGGTGGLGGGGNVSGGNNSGIPGYPGTANTGGGGGGSRSATSDSWNGGNGGSGIVIVRYPGLPAATGGTITYLNGYTIHTFTTSGTFTPYLWNDVSGNNNNGSLVNGIGFNSYENGGFLTFDGSDDFVTIAGGTLNNGSTLEMWFKQTTNKQVELLKYGTGTIDTPGCHAVYYVPNTLYCLNFINGTRTFVSITHTINLGDSTWRQLLLSYTGNLTGGTASLYINGQLITSTSSTSANASFDGPGFSSNSSYAFPGNLSTLRVYSRGLSAAEVLQNYNAQKNRFGL